MSRASNFFNLDSLESDSDQENKVAVQSQGSVAERNPMKKRKKKIADVEKPDSEADHDDGGKKLKKKKIADVDKPVSEADRDDGEKKSKKKLKKKVSDGDEIGDNVNESSEGSPSHANALVNTDDAKRDKGKRKRDDDTDLGAEGDTSHKPKKKKKKTPIIDSENILSSANATKKKSKENIQCEHPEADGTKDANQIQSRNPEAGEKDLNKSTKDPKKKKKQTEDTEVEENNTEKKQTEDTEAEVNDLDSLEIAKKKSKKKKKQSDDPEAEENNNDGKEKSKKKKKQSEDTEAEENNNNGKKKSKKKKQIEDTEAEENNNNGKKEKNKKKQKGSKSDEVVTTPPSKSAKKVNFSDQVEVFPAESQESDEEEEEEDEQVVDMVRGKRFTKQEDDLIKKAVLEYVDNHALGEEGINMVMDCKSHKQIRGCWKEIASALPWRPLAGVYDRAHTLFEEGSRGVWSKEDLELVVEYQKKHGNDWKTLADAMGKHRKHVKDAWRRIRLASKKRGHWSMEEYQSLFDLVNKDLRMKAFQEKHSKHGMLRDNIPWMAISDQLGTRDHAVCCLKWYDQLTSPMVANGIWANVDDYRLLEELTNLDAVCVDDVDWDNLLDNRDGDACRSRWNQMVRHIGIPGTKTFAEQVEILSQRYCPDIAEDREDFDNRPFDPED